MNIHPTRNAVDLTVVGIGLVAGGAVVGNALWIGWGGSLLLGLQLARAITFFAVSNVRRAGFEMLWLEEHAVRQCTVGSPITLSAEVRNRDGRAARYIGLRSVHSPNLSVVISPTEGEVPGAGSLRVDVTVVAQRVGRHGLYGLSLELQGSPGLFEVPLTFANPFGIEALPHYTPRSLSARRGSSLLTQLEATTAYRSGGDFTLRELRDYAPGDAFKRIAWKASARRGSLMTKEFDLPDRGVVWMVLDASVELWSGVPGRAPLDAAISGTAELIAAHLRDGDRVGLALVGHRRLAWIEPAVGAAHLKRVMECLARETGTGDRDRSGFSTEELASRVSEHIQPLTAAAAPAGDLQTLGRTAAELLARAPFRVNPTSHAVDDILRAYATAFGLPERPRLEPDAARTASELLSTLQAVMLQHPSRVYLLAPPPEASNDALFDGLARLPRRDRRIYWLMSRADAGLSPPRSPRETVLHRAAQWRAQAATMYATTRLAKTGVRVVPAHALHKGRSRRHLLLPQP